MSPDPAAPRVLHGARVLFEEGPVYGALQAAGDRSFLQEDGETTLPPAGASRAETVFNAVGLFLLVVLAVSMLWVLWNRRR